MTAEDLKKSILQQAIQGKLVPQNPNDEPASALLERIRAEKTRLVAEGKIKRDKNESVIYRNADGQYIERIGKTEIDITDQIPFGIPKGWEWCRVRNISQSYIGLTYKPSELNNTGTIVLRSSNIKNGKLDLNDLVRVSTPVNEKLWVQKHDIIICARNGSKKLVGKSAIIDDIKEPMTFGAFMAVCKTPIYKFAYIFLQSPFFFNQLNDVSSTTTINQLTQNNFNNFFIPIPPLAEQERIVEKIEGMLPMVEEYGKAQSRLEELNSSLGDNIRKSVLQYAIQGKLVPQNSDEEPASVLLDRISAEKARLVAEGKIKRDKNESVISRNPEGQYIERIGKTEKDISVEIPFEIPENWEWTRFSFVAEIARGGSPRPIKSFLTDAEDGVNWIKIGDTEKGSKYINSVKEKIKPSGVSKSRMVKKGDFLLTNSMSFGRPYITNVEGCIHDGWLVISPFLDTYNSDFLFYLLSSPFAFNQFSGKVSGAVVKNLNTDKVLNALIPLPPLSEQKRIVERINQILSLYK